MKRQQLLIAAIATVLSVTAASATDITGAVLQDGVYNINPEKINGTVGYRHYTSFDLSQGDVAKLIYQGQKSGQLRDLETFINLVNNQVKINGILNAVKNDGTGHAIFITPQGMTVGQYGVINAGTLSVITPTQEKFNKLKGEYDIDDFTNINQINKMRNNTAVNNNNYGGNAPVKVNGFIFARNGVDLRGSKVDVTGGIVNGYKPANDFSAEDFDGQTSAAALFNTLVNTDGIATTSADLIKNTNSSIVIKSGAGEENYIKVTQGKIGNLTGGETVLTNHGDAGLTITGGVVAGNGKVNIYNNNATGTLEIVNGIDVQENPVVANLNAHKNSLSVTSKGGLNVQSGNLKAKDDVEIVNKGNALNFAGTALAGGKIDVINSGNNGANISGNLGTSTAKANVVRIVNENGKLIFAGQAHANESVSVRGMENAEGMEIAGTIKAGEGVLVENRAGDMELKGLIQVAGHKVENDIENVAIAVFNKGDGQLISRSNSQITADDGNIAIKNSGDEGMALAGTITNVQGDTAINNTKGAMTVNGTIANSNGNMGIINRGEGKMTVGATVNNAGKLKLANVNGEDFEISGNVTNTDGNFSVYNDNGHLDISGDLTNSNGYLFIYSRNNSEGIATTQDSNIHNTNGDLAIKHNGTGAVTNGLDLNGTITKDGQNGELAINNYADNMHVGGTINTNAKTGIVNRNGADDMTFDATVNAPTENELRIKNEAGTGNITVGGEITHGGRLNILANDGTLTLEGKTVNQGTDRTYAIARNQADGIVVTEDFDATSTNGMIYILNKVGEDGLQYKGKIDAGNAQAELYNMTGNMVVDGGSFKGNPAVILNKGDKLTVTNTATVTGSKTDSIVRIVNKGSEAAEIGTNHKANFREQLKN